MTSKTPRRITAEHDNTILGLLARTEDCVQQLRVRIDGLISRVESLEADGPAVPSRGPTPASSLVERVAGAMGPSSQAAMDAGELPYGSACAAIREVAAWLRDRGDYPMEWAWIAQTLEQEADR